MFLLDIIHKLLFSQDRNNSSEGECKRVLSPTLFNSTYSSFTLTSSTIYLHGASGSVLLVQSTDSNFSHDMVTIENSSGY